MTRTTAGDVDDILDTTIETTILEAWVEAANDIVNDVAAADPSIPSGRLERIEKFYAAHLATAQDPRVSSQSGESRSVSYEDRESEGTASYYEVAVTLDPTGIIRDAQKPTATLSVPDTKGIYD